MLLNFDFHAIYGSGYPLHRENRENSQKKSLSGKTQGIWKCCQNTGKTQGIWFAQVVNSLILKVKDISKFATKISPKNVTLEKSAKSVLCNSHKSCKLAQGKFAFGQGKNRKNTGNLKIQFEWVP